MVKLLSIKIHLECIKGFNNVDMKVKYKFLQKGYKILYLELLKDRKYDEK